ncbi:MAG: hypothetical protein IPM46_04665 [Flavobacteriales bacterium]|nr:hypothetical protein [Flavobacteriales bacterium]
MRIAVIIAQGLMAVSAIPCGLMLMLAPDGRLIQLPLDSLTNSPFTDFFWPGLLLFGVLGVGHAVGLVLTLRHSAHASRAALALGLGTIIWIVVQVIMTDPFHWMQVVISGLGIIQVIGHRSV